MKYDPSKPWVLLMCFISLMIGFLEDFVIPVESRILKLSDEFKDIKVVFLTLPQVSVRSLSSVITNPQFYMDTFSMTIVLMMESMICWGMISITTDQMYLSKTKNMFALVAANLSTILTGSLGCTFSYARSYLNEKAGAKS